MTGRTFITLFALVTFNLWTCPAKAQNTGQRELMQYVIVDGDTVYLAPLKPARIYEKKPRQKGREWRKYYKLVWNFARTYPYAVVAKSVVGKVDSTIKADNLKYVSKDRYVNKVVKDLFNSFEKPMRNMTISQGALLMRLIDRECGIKPYEIIKEFKNAYAASFWQGIAKMFDNDLKRPYDPEGLDAPTEELVHQWWDGRFEQTYFEIFWEYPPIAEIPQKYVLSSDLPLKETPEKAKINNLAKPKGITADKTQKKSKLTQPSNTK